MDYATKLKNWSLKGFVELGDFAGMGIGATTKKVLHHQDYLTDPHLVWNVFFLVIDTLPLIKLIVTFDDHQKHILNYHCFVKK